MESESSPLAIESFSDSWLPSSNHNGKPKSTLVMKNQEHFITSQNNFHFDVPISMSPDDEYVLVDADQIFSNGLIKPVFVRSQSRGEPYDHDRDHDLYEEYSPSPSSPGPALLHSRNSSVVRKSGAPVAEVRCNSVVGLGRWRKSSEKVLRRCIGYLRPICQRVLLTSKRSVRVDDIDRRSLEVKSRTSSAQSTPSRAEPRPGCGWSDSESSIYEAVLHCKRSIDWYVLYDLARVLKLVVIIIGICLFRPKLFPVREEF